MPKLKSWSAERKIAFTAALISKNMTAWIAEVEVLGATPNRTPKQQKRHMDLEAALDTYQATYGDIEKLPKEPWITRALKAVN